MELSYLKDFFRILVIICWASIGTSCVSMLFAGPKVKSQGYEIVLPPPPWRRIDAGGADLAYQRPDDHSTISLNSVCEQYQGQSLEELTKGVALGLTDSRMIATERLVVSGFPALRTTVEGRVDSQPVTVNLTVVRTSHCVYDFIMAARREAFPQHLEAVTAMVASFREGAEP